MKLLCDASSIGSLSAGVRELLPGSFYTTGIVGVPIGNHRRIDTNADGVPDTDNTNFMNVPEFDGAVDVIDVGPKSRRYQQHSVAWGCRAWGC